MSEETPSMLTAPWKIMPGEELRLADARITREPNGDLEACDRYGCASARVPPERPVYAVPIPAVYRVLPATPFIYVDFDKRIFVEQGEDYWITAPFEIEVYAGDLALIRLSPIKVKYTLIGDVIEGTLARYFRSDAVFDFEDLKYEEHTAIIRFFVRGSSVLLPGIGFRAAGVEFYVDDKGRIYYPMIEVTVSNGNVSVKTTNRPPIPGLKPVVLTRYARPKRVLAFTQAYSPSFEMKVDVVKRYLPQP